MMGQRGQEDRNVQLYGQPLQAGNMVGVLVRNHDGGDFLGALAQGPQPLESFAAGKASIHQNSRRTSRHQRAVPTTAASEHRHRHSHSRSLPLPAVETGTVFQLRYLWWELPSARSA